jgi:hypothetical protein
MFNQILFKLQKNYFLDVGNHRNTIFLAGTGRSGTTWVQDVINHDGSHRILFEPFHSQKIGLLKEWNYRQYVRPENRESRFLLPASAILRGRIRDPWVDQFNTRIVANKRLIKDIRANLFLKWIKRNFPEIPLILLLRHPCAVASSKLKLGWESHLKDFLEQDELMADFLNPYKKEIASAKDMFEKHIFMWCIENYVPLRQFEPGEILVVFYEDFCADPLQVASKIRAFLGKSPLPYALEVFGKPSLMSRADSAIVSRSDLVESWRKDVSPLQIKRAVEILSLFGLEKVYNEGSFPLVGGQESLCLFAA